MNFETNPKEELIPKDVLFSCGCYEIPIQPFDSDKPQYNPSINAMYIPTIQNELGARLAFEHEFHHWILSRNPASCFLQILSNFIYHEMTCPNYNGNPDISAISPANNSIVRMFKAFYDILLKQTAYVQEAYALFHANFSLAMDLHARNLGLVNNETNVARAKDLAQITNQGNAIAQEEAKLPGFETIYKRYRHLKHRSRDTRSHKYLELFPLSGPLFFPVLPVTANGLIDSSQITDEFADEAIAKFKSAYNRLPFSPPKRFLSIISIVEKMIEHNVEFNGDNLRRWLQKLCNFDQAIISRYDVCYHRCPVDTLHSQGIAIPYDDFGPPYTHLTDPKSKRLNCRKTAFGAPYTETIDVSLEIHEDKVIQSKGYMAYWPLPTFLTASEFLKNLVFNGSISKRIFPTLTLVEKIRFAGNHDYNILPRPPKLSYTQKFSPFISVKTITIDSAADPSMDAFLT